MQQIEQLKADLKTELENDKREVEARLKAEQIVGSVQSENDAFQLLKSFGSAKKQSQAVKGAKKDVSQG